MFNQIFPRQLDNTYRGSTPALWIFGLVVFVKTAISINSIFNAHSVARSADGIPLDTFTAAGAQAVVSLFASLGLSQLIICLFCILVLVRYRALIPFMFVLLLVEHGSRKLINYILPIVHTGTPPGSLITLVLLSLIVIGLALSLLNRKP